MRADVAGVQPAVVELRFVAVAVIGAGDPRAAHLHLADRLAVVRQRVAVVVDDPRLHAAHRPALRGRAAPTAARLGTPGSGRAIVASGEVSVMPHACTICTPCCSSNVFIIDIGTADPPQRHQPQRRDVVAGILFQIVHHVVPDRRHRGGHASAVASRSDRPATSRRGTDRSSPDRRRPSARRTAYPTRWRETSARWEARRR